jgi:hypothetical protein
MLHAYQRPGENCYIHLPPEDGSSSSLRNVGNYLSEHSVPEPRTVYHKVADVFLVVRTSTVTAITAPSPLSFEAVFVYAVTYTNGRSRYLDTMHARLKACTIFLSRFLINSVTA